MKAETFVDGLNAMALIQYQVLVNHGLSVEEAGKIIQEGLDVANKCVNGKGEIIIGAHKFD